MHLFIKWLKAEVCSPYLKEAEKQLVRAAQKRNVDAPNIEPRVSVSIQEPDKLQMIIRVPAPVRKRGRIEQEILHRFLDEYFKICPVDTQEEDAESNETQI